MSWFRRLFGIDPIEAMLWVAAATLTGFIAIDLYHDDMMGAPVALLALLGYTVRRHFALKRMLPDGETSGAWRVADLESRVAELELLHQRVAELEERLDFNERLLAQQHEVKSLEGGR